MSFLRHREIYQVEASWRGRNHGPARALRLDESPVGYSLAGCSPAEPTSASPTGGYSATMARRIATSNSLLSLYHLSSWSHSRGAPQNRKWKPFKRFPLSIWAERYAWLKPRRESEDALGSISQL